MNPTLELLKIKADLYSKDNHYSINETEIIKVLGNEIPELNPTFDRTENKNNIYVAMHCFANFTKHLIRKGDLKEVKHCFHIAEAILKRGNTIVKNSIENGYLYSLSSILDLTTPASNSIKGILPELLRKEYRKQVGTSGI